MMSEQAQVFEDLEKRIAHLERMITVGMGATGGAAVITRITDLPDDFFTADTEARDKFEDGFIIGDKIAAGTITAFNLYAGTIESKLIQTENLRSQCVIAEKIYSGEIMTNRISADHLRTDIAVITDTAQIETAIITNVKILSGTIEFDRCVTNFGRESFFKDNTLIVTGEHILGYTPTTVGDGDITFMKNHIQLQSGTAAGGAARVRGGALIEKQWSPTMKAKAKVNATTNITAEVTCGITGSEWSCFGFRFNNGKLYGIRSGMGEAVYHSVLLDPYLANTYYILEARLTTTGVKFYVNGEYILTSTTHLPTSPMEDCHFYVNDNSQVGNKILDVYHFSVKENWMD